LTISLIHEIYKLGETNFVGRYRKSGFGKIDVSAQFGIEKQTISRDVELPDSNTSHTYLPRLWARAKVDFLIEEMNRNGERKDFISEIIWLSEKYKFVTPYTAFLAAPRALLRPRMIQPGDPVIRLKTDSSITEVFAVLPFGETLPLKFMAAEGVWETRFLAPVSMADGQYRCRILMKDKDGNGFEEVKTFVVDSHAPKLKIEIKTKTFHAGEEIVLKVSSDADTAKLIAKFYGANPTQLFWSNKEKANIGELQLPNNLAAGKYILTVTAEDFAHNLSSTEIEVQIL
jgi:Ca-activated chloride channel homolog